MSDACNFALDVQKLAQRGPLTQDQLKKLVGIWGGFVRLEDGGIDFPDGSIAVWKDGGFELIETKTEAQCPK